MKVQDLKLFENRKLLDFLGRVCTVGELGSCLSLGENGFYVCDELIDIDKNTTIDEFLQKAFVIKQNEKLKEEHPWDDTTKYVDYETALKEAEIEIMKEQRERAIRIDYDERYIKSDEEKRKEFLFLQSKKQPAIYYEAYYSGDEMNGTTFYEGKTRKEFYDERIKNNKRSIYIDTKDIEEFRYIKIADVTTTCNSNISKYRILNDIITSFLKNNNFENNFVIDPFKIKTDFGDIEFGLDDETSVVLSRIEELFKSQLKDKESMEKFKSVNDVLGELPKQYIQEAKDNAEILDFEDSDPINRIIKVFERYKNTKANFCFKYRGEMIYICDTSIEEFVKKIKELQEKSLSRPSGSPLSPPPPLKIETLKTAIESADLTFGEIQNGYGIIEKTTRENENIENEK